MKKRQFDETYDSYQFFMVDSPDPVVIDKNDPLAKLSNRLTKLSEPKMYLPFTVAVLEGLRCWIRDGRIDCSPELQKNMIQLSEILDLRMD